jgi:cold shock protein
MEKIGVVKSFNVAKGFGFITEDGTNKDFFVHVSGLLDSINAGDKVCFSVFDGKKGPQAINVKRQ